MLTEIPKRIRYFALEIILFLFALVSGAALVWMLTTPGNLDIGLMVMAGAVFTLSLLLTIRLLMDPDNVRARQSDAILQLASQTLACLLDELSVESAQKICQLLLPASPAVAVAITDKDCILGYAGVEQNNNQGGTLIRTAATHSTLSDGETRIMMTPEEIGFPSSVRSIKAAIIVPLTVAGKPEGTLKFYYKTRRNINETQVSVAEGFGELLSTQMAASALEQQTKLATSMELKALQSQINPHFLFNTINTIASLIRTDPEKARILLREFAVFYRRTLEDSSDLIVFSRELEQVQRYFTFEVARFGEDRLCLDIEIEPDVEGMMVPAFMVQPLVENAVRHAMPSEGMLSIHVSGQREGDDVLVCIEDDGVGMTDEARDNILHPQSETGLGIAVKNVNDRMRGYFGRESHMDIDTELGRGTRVVLFLKNGAIHEYN
ncbi:MAG: histidine kinase [Raoultibacter sp.]